jgi:hypothetical protein
VTKSPREVSYLVGRLPRSRMVLGGWGTTWRGHHGGRWAVYRATWTTGDSVTLITSWSDLQSYVASGELTLVRDAAADFRCPVLGNPEPIN